jgi:hypothetical protein
MLFPLTHIHTDTNTTWDNSVGILPSHRLDDRGSVPSRGGDISFAAMSRSVLGLTGKKAKRLGRESDHPPVSSTDVFMASCLIKQKDNFIFSLYMYTFMYDKFLFARLEVFPIRLR